ncbi:MAG TPA: hypothetical protein VGF28_24500 [Thermoanaerobaculia bacterium]|jgi:hypothetical protein
MLVWLLRLYRLLLLLQPRELRRRYADEMLAVVRARSAAEGSPSFWMREFADLVTTAAVVRRPRAGWLLLVLAVAHAAYALAVYPAATMGVGAILLTAGALLGGAAMAAVPATHESRRG